jgi:hypothetical protein
VITTPTPLKDGYCITEIKNKKYKVHRLVALVHRDCKGNGYTEGYVTDHVDGDRSNNHKSNLEWVTVTVNNQRARETNKSFKSSAPKQSKPVKGRVIGADAWRTFASASEAASELGIDQGNISACAHKRVKYASKDGVRYEFEFDEPTEPDVLVVTETTVSATGEVTTTIITEEWRDIIIADHTFDGAETHEEEEEDDEDEEEDEGEDEDEADITY